VFELEREVSVWRGALSSKGSLSEESLDELESHLRDEMAELSAKGLEPDEAFLVGAKRVGNLDSVAREFARAASEELWKRMVLDRGDPESGSRARLNLAAIVLLALLSALATQVPALFGLDIARGYGMTVFNRFWGFYFMPFIGLYLLFQRGAGTPSLAAALACYAIPAAALAAYSFPPGSATSGLSAIHSLIFVWIGTAAAYCGAGLRDPRRRMDFVRFSGEAFLFGVLLACGVVVLYLIVAELFKSIGIDASGAGLRQILPMGIAASGFGAAVLAKAKRNVIENFAPVLARIFVPLFLAAFAVFLALMAARGRNPFVDRDILIGFDFMLALVVGLALYTLSAREPRKAAGIEDWACLLLVVAALVIDALALGAIWERIGAYGASPNKLAALGENILLFADLAGLAACYAAFLAGRRGVETAVRWQTAFFLPIFAWALFVALGFPPIFGFR
jgi:hypothetical protein